MLGNTWRRAKEGEGGLAFHASYYFAVFLDIVEGMEGCYETLQTFIRAGDMFGGADKTRTIIQALMVIIPSFMYIYFFSFITL